MLDISDVNNAVLAATAALGDPLDGPLQFDKITDHGGGKFSVTFFDRRGDPASFRPVFSFVIDTETDPTFDAVQTYASGRIRDYLMQPS